MKHILSSFVSSLSLTRRLPLFLAALLVLLVSHASAAAAIAVSLPGPPVEQGGAAFALVPMPRRYSPQPDQPKGSTVAPLPRPGAMVVDSHAIGSWIREHGVAILLDNTNEMAGMITPPTKGLGLRQGASNAGQYSMTSDVDWERLAGLNGLASHSVIVGRYGIPVSRMFGDNLNPSQEIYGAGGNVFVHLVFAYAEETLLHGRLGMAAGRMSFLSDFSASPLYCNFMNNAFCGNPKAASDNTAHASYPNANWAMRIRLQPSETTAFKFGVYLTQTQAIYRNAQMRTGFKFNGATIDGVAIPIEFGWEPKFGHNGTLTGHYKTGFSYDTADHMENYRDDRGKPYALSGLPARSAHGAWAAWALFDQMVYHHPGSAPDSGITVLGVAYFNKPETQTRADQFSLGALDRGFWSSRPGDAVGVNFSWIHISDDLSRSQRLFASQGRPLPDGSLFPQTRACVLEATYQIRVLRGVTFAPDFQYYFNPGAQKMLRDQAVLGFKSFIELF